MRTQFSKSHLPTASAALAVAVMLLLTVFASSATQAQTFTVLHTFTDTPDGANPWAPLLLVNGELYGTTRNGGPTGKGSLFELNSRSGEILVRNIGGGYPSAGLIVDSAGNFYGVAEVGGAFSRGTVFKVDTTGRETVLYTFTGGADGSNPDVGLVMDSTGNLYGATGYGGAYGLGTVFKLDTSNLETVLHSFKDVPDGAYPMGGNLVIDSAGNLYGTTLGGGANDMGTVYSIDPTGVETILHSFNGTDGQGLISGVIRDGDGNLYGTAANEGPNGWGVVFRIDATGAFNLLHSFPSHGDGNGFPNGGLVRDGSGNLYGTTAVTTGGYCGTVFKINTQGKLRVLHKLDCATEGSFLRSDLIIDNKGNLYGTASTGGASNCPDTGYHGCGTVFKLTP